MAYKYNELNSISEVVRYWRECLNELGEIDDAKVAERMVRVLANPPFWGWYGDPDQPDDPETAIDAFAELWELALSLESKETSGGEKMRLSIWGEVEDYLEELERKYL